MSFFNKKHKNHIGVDIGTSNLKLIELSSRDGKYFLETYGIAEIESDVVRKSSKDTELILSKVLQALIKESGASSKNVSSSVPGFSVFNKIIQLPAMKEDKIKEAIKWEAKKYIPFPLESLVLNWHIINRDRAKNSKLGNLFKKKTQDNNSNGIDIFLTAVPKTVVLRYESIFRLAGLRLESLEPEINALRRALVEPEDKKKTVALIDLGSTATEISIIKEAKIEFGRNIDIGGRSITQALMKGLGISFERAEQFKKDFNLKFDQQKAPLILKEVVDKLLGSIKNSFQLYTGGTGGEVEKIVLSGGAAKLKGLAEYLSKRIEIETVIGMPWLNITYPPALEQRLPEISPEFAVAIGLAKRDLL